MVAAIIQKATIQDLKKLLEIGKQTFSETFADGNTAENLATYLEEDFSTEKLTMELNSPYSEFYLAIQNGEIIGYLKLNVGSAQTEIKEDNGLEIERFYVLKDFHGKNIGPSLLEKAIEIAKQKEKEYIWLGVWENNPRAIRFYKKNGFVEFDKHVFVLGDDEQTDIMMKLTLANRRVPALP
jgi:ribosomal protein S18 acetylase RimI-like enzyme